MPKDKAIQLIDTISTSQILDLKVEIERDVSGKITQGIVIGNTLQQNKALILITQPGENKFNPNLGIGIADLLLDHNYLAIRHKTRQQFSIDGLKISKLDLYENKPLVIDAKY